MTCRLDCCCVGGDADQRLSVVVAEHPGAHGRCEPDQRGEFCEQQARSTPHLPCTQAAPYRCSGHAHPSVLTTTADLHEFMYRSALRSALHHLFSRSFELPSSELAHALVSLTLCF